MTNQIRELKPKDLRWRCDPRTLGFETTESLSPIEQTIGQERALEALRMGVGLFSKGYNIFVCGLTGTGKTTAVKKILENIRSECPIAPDRCYVFNFKDQDSPILLTFPRGKGSAFSQDMEEMLDVLKKQIPLIFDQDAFNKKRDAILKTYQNEEREIFTAFESRIRERGFTLAQVQVGAYSRPDIFFLVDEKPVPVEQLESIIASGKLKMKPEEMKAAQKNYEGFKSELRKNLSTGRRLAREMVNKIQELETKETSYLVDGLIDDLKEEYGNKGVSEYLDNVRENLLKNLSLFKEKEEGEEGKAMAVLGLAAGGRARDPFLEYRVNVILDNSHRVECPVILETAPTCSNLFGTIERVTDRQGNLKSNFTHIKGGALLKADGGFLVINALDALTEPGVWKTLKRTLKYNRLEIQTHEALYPYLPQSMKPEPIEVNLKVILIGDNRLYHYLYNLDEDFKKVFKIKADFDVATDLSKERIQAYAAFVRKICHEEKLKNFEQGAVAAVVELAVRKAGRKGKISTRFGMVADFIREANFWSKEDQSHVVGRDHVMKAIEEADRRNCLFEDRIQELIDRETIFIDTEGSRVGQVNGLSVYDLGNYAFGRPTRITVNTSVGKAGILNIEREAKLSGKTHDKGVLILSGYFREKFGQDRAISFSASICFEQSYGDIDGDSASSTEIFALLSSLSGVPIRQGIAVTGSINQKGDIQPIGGANYKVEGFFKVCKARGLTGDQGVIIPAANEEDLMLDNEVVEAVRKKKFHIYSISSVDEGIEILTGIPAGRPGRGGSYPKGTIYYLVSERLQVIAKHLERSSASAGKKAKGKKKKVVAKKTTKKKKKTKKKKSKIHRK